MPAINMGSDIVPAANPSTGAQVNFCPFSGPKGSPFDAKSFDPTTRLLVADPTNYSTGALSTGIGVSCLVAQDVPATPMANFVEPFAPGFAPLDGGGISNTVPTPPDNTPYGAALYLIGGGHSNANINGEAVTNPYTYQVLGNMGNGASRDAGAGPAFTCFGSNLVTAPANIAPGGATPNGINRSGVTVLSGQEVFESLSLASPAIVLTTP